jgi:hypothetical protein
MNYAKNVDFGFAPKKTNVDFGATPSRSIDFGKTPSNIDFGKLVIGRKNPMSGFDLATMKTYVANNKLLVGAVAAMLALAVYSKQKKGTYNFSKLFIK